MKFRFALGIAFTRLSEVNTLTGIAMQPGAEWVAVNLRSAW
jgi:hypothetical protein